MAQRVSQERLARAIFCRQWNLDPYRQYSVIAREGILVPFAQLLANPAPKDTPAVMRGKALAIFKHLMGHLWNDRLGGYLRARAKIARPEREALLDLFEIVGMMTKEQKQLAIRTLVHVAVMGENSANEAEYNARFRGDQILLGCILIGRRCLAKMRTEADRQEVVETVLHELGHHLVFFFELDTGLLKEGEGGRPDAPDSMDENHQEEWWRIMRLFNKLSGMKAARVGRLKKGGLFLVTKIAYDTTPLEVPNLRLAPHLSALNKCYKEHKEEASTFKMRMDHCADMGGCDEEKEEEAATGDGEKEVGDEGGRSPLEKERTEEKEEGGEHEAKEEDGADEEEGGLDEEEEEEEEEEGGLDEEEEDDEKDEEKGEASSLSSPIPLAELPVREKWCWRRIESQASSIAANCDPRQVFDINAMRGPKYGLEVFRKIGNQLRILVCGEDGTVGWVLSTLDQLIWPAYPPIALLPLGTGNDLSRCMDWGGTFSSDEPLVEVLAAIQTETSVTHLDRWRLDVFPLPNSEGSQQQNGPPTAVTTTTNAGAIDLEETVTKIGSRRGHPWTIVPYEIDSN